MLNFAKNSQKYTNIAWNLGHYLNIILKIHS